MNGSAPFSLAARLRTLTPARVGLGRTGVSQQTRDLLDFQQAHAQARDAVHARLEVASLAAALSKIQRIMCCDCIQRLRIALFICKGPTWVEDSTRPATPLSRLQPAQRAFGQTMGSRPDRCGRPLRFGR